MGESTHLLQRIQRLLDSIGSPEERLDETSRRILLQLADARAEGRKLRVTDVISVSEYGTAPTVLSRLKKLTEMGLISSEASSTDGRARELSITPKTLKKLNYIAAQIRGFASTD